jgi:CrcB protein
MQILYAGLGGFLGAALRHGAHLAGHRWQSAWSFPAVTLGINVLGCFLLGWLTAYATTRGTVSEDLRVFLGVGILGGFTTWSAFGVDTIRLWSGDLRVGAVLYVLLHLVLSLVAVVVGWRLASA